MESTAVRHLEPSHPREPAARATSPLAAARLARKWTPEELARRSGLTPDEVVWLEEGRVYRFRSTDDALLAMLLYAAGLGIDQREARELAGLPVPPHPIKRSAVPRFLAIAGSVIAALALAAFFLRPGDEASKREAAARADAKLPPRWEISVDVLNGGGDIVYTRRVATRIGALGYQITRVRRADRFDYPETSVFYEEGGQEVAERLAAELQVEARPLPSGSNARRLVVVVGPPQVDAA
jgi:transcriptional regulator with XRE-family HTH domain